MRVQWQAHCCMPPPLFLQIRCSVLQFMGRSGARPACGVSAPQQSRGISDEKIRLEQLLLFLGGHALGRRRKGAIRCVPEKLKPDIVSHVVLMIPGARGGRRRPSYLAPALSETVPAGGPLQTRASLLRPICAGVRRRRSSARPSRNVHCLGEVGSAAMARTRSPS